MDLQELITKLQAILAEHGNKTGLLYADHNGEEYYIVDVCYKRSTNTVVLYEP
jgi:hypothetical protein